MRKSINQNFVYRADQQLLSCSKRESTGMLAASINGNEFTSDFSSVQEQMKQQPRRTYR
ncbi:hypothetical protein [Paenibacillus agricola]|uniref:YpzG-like protein n=1 Tax=Paenibacillus agricola TaxID=2716264 RepID=A0ABX0J268_9BACL|nr:hypothetical protein [Paenibacillus agricola]NHN30053.1 hypothetical protein [Paenibacillus agricola]